MNSRVEEQLKLEPNKKVKILINVIVLAIILIPCFTQINFPELNANAAGVVQKIFSGIFHPEFQFALNFGEDGLFYLLMQTLAIAFIGTFIGTLIALPLAFLASSRITSPIISTMFSWLIIAIRTFPLYVYAIIFIKIVGGNALCGVLTIGITSVGMIAKLFIEAIEGIDQHLLDSAKALGLTNWQKVYYIIFAQLKSNFISTAIYRFDINVKNSTVLGLVGAGGIGTAINAAIGADDWQKFGIILIALVIIILIVDFISTKIRKALV